MGVIGKCNSMHGTLSIELSNQVNIGTQSQEPYDGLNKTNTWYIMLGIYYLLIDAGYIQMTFAHKSSLACYCNLYPHCELQFDNILYRPCHGIQRRRRKAWQRL